MPKKLLFLSGPALGHVSRLGSVAKHVRQMADAAIQFAVPAFSPHQNTLTEAGFDVVPVNISDSARAFPAIEFADGIAEVFQHVRPDMIVHDMCPVRWLSAVHFPDCTRVNVTNYFLTRAHGAPTFQKEWYDRIHDQLAEIRASRDLHPLTSVFDLYDADKVLLADPPDLFGPQVKLPPNYELCGPTFEQSLGQPPIDLAGDVKILLLSMGSTGRVLPDADLVSHLKHWCRGDTSVYAGTRTTKARSLALADKYFEWLPLNPIMPKCQFAITQGGAGSTYMALAAGVPVGVVPSDPNHRILGDLVEDAGLGLCLGGADDAAKIEATDHATLSANAKAFAAHPVDGSRVIATRIAELME